MEPKDTAYYLRLIKDAIGGVNGACDGKNSTKSQGGGDDGGGLGSILGGGGDVSNLFDIEDRAYRRTEYRLSGWCCNR